MTAPDYPSLDKAYLWHPFTPMRQWCAPEHHPLLLTRGEGCWLYDQHGNRYLDGNSSIWTNVHGHGHPTINAAIKEQVDRVAHTSFLGFTHAPAIELGKALIELFTPDTLSRVFYSDDGSTAIESAIRLALQYWPQNGRPERNLILAFHRAYHGDTLGAASLGGITLFKGSANHYGYEVLHVADMQAVRALDEATTQRIAAVIIEPLIQGSAGMRLWPQGMLQELRQWCHTQDTFLILDEVMTGFGRTGRMFACEHEGVVPDFLCLAKGLTAGYLPMAATLTTQRVYEGFLGEVQEGRTFYYGHSYTASQLGCAAGLANLQVFREEDTLIHLQEKIALMTDLLGELSALPNVLEVRQCGFIAGIEIGQSKTPREPFPAETLTGAKVCLAARKQGLLTRPILDTLVLMPPLSITATELKQAVEALRSAIQEVCG